MGHAAGGLWETVKLLKSDSPTGPGQAAANGQVIEKARS